MLRHHRYRFTLICLLILWLAPISATASDAVWRMAGTFNSWNAGDDQWRLEIHPDRSWIFRTEKLIQPGIYRFKFVRNGDWNDAHFGLVPGSENNLEQPGEDIILEVPGLGFYGFELNTQDRTWSLEVASVSEPIVSAVWFGPRVTGETMALNYASSITNSPLNQVQPQARFISLPDGVRESEIDLAIDQELQLVVFSPPSPGKYEIVLSLSDDGSTASERFGFTIPSDAPEGSVPFGSAIEFAFRGEANTTRVELVGPITRVLHTDSDSVPLTPWTVEADGTTVFRSVLVVPDGAFEYGFRINGGLERADPSDLGTRLSGTRSRVVIGPRPEDFAAAKPGQINRDAILFNEQSPLDWTVLSDGLGLIDVSVRTLAGDVSAAAFVLYKPDPEDGVNAPHTVPLVRSDDPTGFDRWSARVHAGQSEFEYRFIFFDRPARHATELSRAVLDCPDPLDLPDWAKGAVYYQIFTERFRNGNPSNDPHGPDVTPIPWNADWYTNQPDEEFRWRPRAGLEADAPLPQRQGGDHFHWVWDRRYGGDLQGVVEKLDYIKDLGITAIYFNPVFEGDSMHKYDASAFHHIDDNFGAPGPVPPRWTHQPDNRQHDPEDWSWTESDRYFLDVLLPEARRRGIRVVIDGVWNHTGRNFWAWQDILQHGADSPYAEWFYVNFDENGTVESWQAWDGPQGWLPKFRQTATGDLIDPVKKHIEDVTQRWMDPNGDGDPSDGVDGWRLDVPLNIGLPFWEDWRELVKSINPDAVIIAEIWQPADPYLTGKHFDTQMHYPFAHAVTDWLGVRTGMTAQQLATRLEQAFNDTPQTNLIHQNLFASHDTDRFVSMLINPGRGYDQANRPQDNGPEYRDVRPSAEVYKRSLLGVAIQSLYIGSPMVYYGDEVGMWGADDPTNRKPMPWPDMGPYQNPDDRFDEELLSEYRRWLNLRQDDRLGTVLRYGTVRHLDSGNPDVFAFERRLNGQRLIAVVNRANEEFDASALLPDGPENPAADPVVPPVSARSWMTTEQVRP